MQVHAILLIAWCVGTLVPSGCVLADDLADDLGDDEQGEAYFETHIRPLFAKHCYQCHSEKAKKQEGGLLLDRASGWVAGGDRGPSLVPGDAESSLLIQAVRFADASLSMPPSQPLSAPEIKTLEYWVSMGAPGPSNEQVHSIEDPSDPIAGRDHWAFRPLRKDNPPVVMDTNWPQGAIDRFVLARLEEAGMRPAVAAQPIEVLRRLSFQLTGLPPSQLQVDEFLADSRPQAMERRVDRLLSDPQYGERWGRHWLDLARYADSNGLDENFLFREAWRYRNWVIAAINDDLAFDRFLTQQMAGDLLPYESTEQRDRQRIASGFMVIGPKVLLGINKDQQRMDVADEHIDTIGRAVLGQTLGCARCHDHKFDPIPTADYYALAGIFSSTRVMESRYMLGEQRKMEQLIGLGPVGSENDDAYEKYWRERPQLQERKKHAEAALKSLQDDTTEEFSKIANDHVDAIASLAKDSEKSRDERIAGQQALVTELQASLDHPPKIPPRAMIATDVETPSDEAVRIAGQFNDLGEVVARGFLKVLDDEAACLNKNQSGRLALAEWLTDDERQSGQLAARVLANRIWQHLIGRGLVRTVDNFGRTGEVSTHPELLDYLAGRLIDSDWSIKSLVREIALSRTFAMSSQHDADNFARDPDNTLLWRAHRRRLEPEAIRDAMLVAASQLDTSSIDSTVDYLGDQATAVGENKTRRRTDFPCRSVYLPVIRNDLPEIFEAFDFTNPHTTTGARPKTIVPSQGLFMLNDELVMDASEATAKRILSESPTDDLEATIDKLFELILNLRPTSTEQNNTKEFLIRMEAKLVSDGVDEPQLKSLAMACHALFASSRFHYTE